MNRHDFSFPLNTPVRIEVADASVRHQPLLVGPPGNCALRSGRVSLAPGDCVQEHSTQDGEELLIPLTGCGQVTFAGAEALALEPGSVLYIPPRTTHRVSNTGTESLVYVYVYAAATNGSCQAG